MPTRRSEFLTGARIVLPILLGVIPFGLLYGTLASQARVPQDLTQAMSAILFAGSAQLVTAQLVGQGAPGFVIVLTVFVVNLRHALYSASIAPYFQRLAGRWKWLFAYLLTDEAYAATITRLQAAPNPFDHWFYFGAGSVMWLCWQLSTAAGILLGAQAASGWSFDFALPLTFLALVVPALKDKPSLLAAVSAGAISVAAVHLPFKLGLILAAMLGVGIAWWHEGRMK